MRREKPRFRLGRRGLAQAQPARSPTTRIVQQPTIQDVTRWDVSGVEAAIDLHEQGDFRETGLLIDAMGRDDRIAGVRSTRTRALLGKNGVDFSLMPAFEPEFDRIKRQPVETPETQRAAELVDLINPWWADVFTEATLAQILDDVVMIGVHISRVIWERSANSWNIVKLRRWHPSNVYWDENTERFYARSLAGDVLIEPNDPNWLVCTPGGDRSWMGGAVRALGLAYVMRRFDWRDWARFNERHGLPIVAIEEPAEADDTIKSNFYSSVQNMGSTGIVRLPRFAGVGSGKNGFDLRLEEARDPSWESFKAFMERLDASIAILMLGQNLSTEVQGGSFAATTAHMRVRQDYLDADAEAMSTSLRGGGRTLGPLTHWVRFNRGAELIEFSPWPHWSTGIPEDLKTKAEGAKSAGEAAAAWRKIPGVKIRNLDEIAEKHGFEIEVDEEAQNQPPPQPPVPPNSDDSDDDDEPEARRTRRFVATRSGIPVAESSGFVEGQQYVDAISENAQEKLANIFAEDIEDLIRIIDTVDDFEAMKAAVLSKYQDDLPPSEAQDLVQRVVTLAELAGRLSVRQDVPELDR